MSAGAPALSAPPTFAVARSLAKHLTSLYIPGVVLAFVWTGPHAWYVAPVFMLPLVLAHQIDCAGRREREQPDVQLPQWPFDALVYLLAALQIGVVIGTVRLFTQQGIFSVDMLMTYLIVGGASGFSIITAHELIHRRSRVQQGLGRLLLCTVLYEHFYTEHLRGHHVRVGTPDDPATARFGESFEPFFRRTVPAQFRSAWRLEKRRLGDPDMGFWDRRMLRNRVVHGLVVEWSLALGIFAGFGLAAFVAFLVQALSAVRLLEVVNYFEHWGLRRTGHRVRPSDSWDTHSWFTYYGLIGLSRHADHHAYPARPYNQLRVFDEAPLLQYGYVGMVDQVLMDDAAFQTAATLELAQRRLGPFAPEAPERDAKSPKATLQPKSPKATLEPVSPEATLEPVSPEAALEELEAAQSAKRKPLEPGRVARALRALPVPARRTLVFGTLILAVSAAIQWETAGAEMGFAARAGLNAWILAVFAFMIAMRERLEARTRHETFAWSVALVLLVALGHVTQRTLA